ncbi:MAG TPA: hypothetical protein VFI18_12250 [Gaiellales bacterium]|nr:hypothetical protein [Gaiellales bacterium]
MSRSTRITSAVAVLASALALAPAALADGVTPDNRADRTGPSGLAVAAPTVTPDNRADRTGPAGAAVRIDTIGTGLLHASMVNAEIAARAGTASTDSGFQWADASIGAAAGFAAALACAGAAVGLRSRRRIAA